LSLTKNEANIGFENKGEIPLSTGHPLESRPGMDEKKREESSPWQSVESGSMAAVREFDPELGPTRVNVVIIMITVAWACPQGVAGCTVPLTESNV
jgi:hypothetical protein